MDISIRDAKGFKPVVMEIRFDQLSEVVALKDAVGFSDNHSVCDPIYGRLKAIIDKHNIGG